MKELRWWCAAFIVWIFALHNADALFQSNVLTPLIGGLAAAATVAIILIPRLHKISPAWLLAVLAGVVLLVKLWAQYPIGGAGFPVTVIELCILGITVILARRIGRSLEDFRTSLIGTMLRHVHQRSRPFESGQAEMYREIRRARRHRRPLALMVISPSGDTVEVSLDRFVKQVADDVARDYMTARIAEFLSQQMTDCDVLTQRGGHFVVLLPEAGRKKAVQIARRLEAAAKDKLGLDLKLGLSTFPDEEITFVGLLERAERDLQEGGCSLSGASSNGDAASHPDPAELHAAPAQPVSQGNGTAARRREILHPASDNASLEGA